MLKFFVCLIVLLMTINHFKVHSVSIRNVIEEQKVTRRDLTTPDSENMSNKLQANEFAHEIANSSLPNYLKDFYVNFPNVPFDTLKD